VTPIPWLTLRLGGYYETGAVPLRYTNVDFASFNRFGLAAGLSLQWRFLRFSVAYSHVFQKDREVSIEETEVYKHYPLSEQEPEQDKLKVGAGTYETSYDIVSLALAFTF
jgi:long-subunit fatty acid transport protein